MLILSLKCLYFETEKVDNNNNNNGQFIVNWFKLKNLMFVYMLDLSSFYKSHMVTKRLHF